DLVVVFSAREDRQLVQVFGAPGGLLGQVDKAVLDHRGLGVHALGEAKLRLTRQALPLATPRAHDLVRLRLVAGDRVEAQLDQFLDQLGPRGLVLDQHDTGVEGLGLKADRALQFGIFHALAQYVQQIEVLAGNAPGGADAEIAELGRLVGGVPALHDAVESGGQLIGRVSPEPRRLDHAATLRCPSADTGRRPRNEVSGGVIRPRCGGSARALPAARVRGAKPRPRGDRRIAAPGVPPNSVSDRCGRLLTYDQVHGMSRHMAERTTVRLPEDLLNRAKRKAAAEGRTLTL